MNQIKIKHPRILALAPSTKGFGFAVFEGQNMLANWGQKPVAGEAKNAKSLVKVAGLIAQYQPGVLVLEDTLAPGSRRAPRIRELSQGISALAADNKVKVVSFSRQQVMESFFADGQGTKHAIAEMIAERFPEELGLELPPKRRPWESEDPRMDTFDAVALILTFRLRESKRPERSLAP